MRGRLVAGLVGATLALSGCSFSIYGTNLPGGTDVGDHPYTVTAYFSDVLDLVPQANVKVNDVAVGKVESISLSKASDAQLVGGANAVGWTAKVKMEVRGDVDLPENARATIQQTTLLGEKFVQLSQPFTAPSATKLHNGSQIPLSRTASAPEVEEVLGALSLVLNGGGIQQVHIIATELNNALRGHESDVRSLLSELQNFTKTLDDQKNRIIDALVSVDNLSKTLNKQSDVLVTTLNTMPQALKILADEKDQLLKLLEGLSSLGVTATDVLNKTQTQLVSSLREINPTLVNLTQVGSNLPKMLKIAGSFPFPIGLTREFVRGDYANLHLYLNFNLQDQLCGLGIIKCNGNTSTAGKHKLTASSASAPAVPDTSTTTDSLPPMLIGAGR
ncbi:MAG: MCE family protein [Jatrophihabitans sp.]|uniref:MCE family protein n=1 Tax=Jatrophihabitans sp. TaxID=1932789 RepID=UPI003F7D53A1